MVAHVLMYVLCTRGSPRSLSSAIKCVSLLKYFYVYFLRYRACPLLSLFRCSKKNIFGLVRSVRIQVEMFKQIIARSSESVSYTSKKEIKKRKCDSSNVKKGKVCSDDCDSVELLFPFLLNFPPVILSFDYIRFCDDRKT